jgi:hypothetical protein
MKITAEARAIASYMVSGVGGNPNDSDRINLLQELTQGYGLGWCLRGSSTGRGMRLSETSRSYAKPTVREAIDAFAGVIGVIGEMCHCGGSVPCVDCGAGLLAMDELWAALCHAKLDRYYTPPYLAYNNPIYGITTRPGFIFDDDFWDVFHSFSFHICHVTSLINESEGFGLHRVFDLRFKPA